MSASPLKLGDSELRLLEVGSIRFFRYALFWGVFRRLEYVPWVVGDDCLKRQYSGSRGGLCKVVDDVK